LIAEACSLYIAYKIFDFETHKDLHIHHTFILKFTKTKSKSMEGEKDESIA